MRIRFRASNLRHAHPFFLYPSLPWKLLTSPPAHTTRTFAFILSRIWFIRSTKVFFSLFWEYCVTERPSVHGMYRVSLLLLPFFTAFVFGLPPPYPIPTDIPLFPQPLNVKLLFVLAASGHSVKVGRPFCPFGWCFGLPFATQVFAQRQFGSLLTYPPQFRCHWLGQTPGLS